MTKLLRFSVLTVLIFLVGCATPIKNNEVRSMGYNCDDVGKVTARLKSEKKKHNKRFRSTARSIIPIGVVVGLVNRDYVHYVTVATGSWAKTVDKKIVEMSEFKKTCPDPEWQSGFDGHKKI